MPLSDLQKHTWPTSAYDHPDVFKANKRGATADVPRCTVCNASSDDVIDFGAKCIDAGPRGGTKPLGL